MESLSWTSYSRQSSDRIVSYHPTTKTKTETTCPCTCPCTQPWVKCTIPAEGPFVVEDLDSLSSRRLVYLTRSSNGQTKDVDDVVIRMITKYAFWLTRDKLYSLLMAVFAGWNQHERSETTSEAHSWGYAPPVRPAHGWPFFSFWSCLVFYLPPIQYNALWHTKEVLEAFILQP